MKDETWGPNIEVIDDGKPGEMPRVFEIEGKRYVREDIQLAALLEDAGAVKVEVYKDDFYGDGTQINTEIETMRYAIPAGPAWLLPIREKVEND